MPMPKTLNPDLVDSELDDAPPEELEPDQLDLDAEPDAPEPEPEPPKRGPGRPRKNAAAPEPAPPKRGPGRPRKDAAAPAPPKRGPGRPRKNAAAPELDFDDDPQEPGPVTEFELDPEPPPPPPTRRRRRSPAAKDPSPLDDIQTDAEKNVYDWLSGFGASGEMKVELMRHAPPQFRGIKTNGLVEVYYEPISLEQIRETHGGGKYSIRVNVRLPGKAAGAQRWRYAGGRTFDISGNPKIEALKHDEADEDPNAAPPMMVGGAFQEEGPVRQAMSLAHQLVADSREDVQRLREHVGRPQGTDPAVQSMIEGLQETVRDLQRQLSSKDDRILELVSQPADRRNEDKLMDMMRDSQSDHTTRVTEIRIAHDAELRQMREFAAQELRQREQRFERELDAMRQQHIREIETIKESHRLALSSQENAHSMRLDGLKETISRQERELAKLESEVGGLRSRKDMGPLDQIQQLAQLKTGMDALIPAPAGAEGEGGPIWERIAKTVMDSPVAHGLADRLSQKPAEPMVNVRRPDGQVVQVPAAYVRQLQAQRQAAGGAPASVPGVAAAPGGVSEGEVKLALTFLESAYRNGQTAKVVAASARNLIPGDILAYIDAHGVDEFLKLAQIEPGSPLATVAGRMYLREVAALIVQTSRPAKAAQRDDAAAAVNGGAGAAPAGAPAPPDDLPEDLEIPEDFDLEAVMSEMDPADGAAVD